MMSFISSIDVSVLHALYAIREPNAVLALIGVSEFGSAVAVVGLAMAIALWLGLRKKFALAQGILLAVATSGIASFIVKLAVARPRPAESFWAYGESGYSFPSAHAALSIALYGFIIFLIWNSGMSRMRKNVSIALLSLLVLAVGFSRLYLGVHYLSDVLAGYLLGAACLWLAIWATKTLKRRVGNF